MTAFSSRSRFDEHTNSLTRARTEAERAGRALLDMTESNPTHAGLSPSARELASLLAHPTIDRYTPEPFGVRSARAAVVAELASRGLNVEVENVLLSASTSEAYGLVFKLLCDPEDEVLVPAPSYPLLDVLAQLERVRLVPYPLRYDGEWHIDHPALLAAQNERTRAIVTVHPNNPTGSLLKRAELARLAELELPIVSDEVFAEYALEPAPDSASSALEVADRALVFRLGGLSKSCALPQLKLAWTAFAGPLPLVTEARSRLEHIADAYLSPSTPVQLALPALLARGAAIRERVLARIAQNRRALELALGEACAADCLRVEAGWYAIMRLPAVLDDEQWALTLLREDDVIVQPGYYYNLDGSYVVLSLIADPASFAEGASRLAARVAAL